MAFKHVSVRVPWHDNNWNGTVCQNPSANASCLVLQNIRAKKDEKKLEEYKGTSIKEMPEEEWPPCVKEKGTFMADFEHYLTISHPYKNKNNPQYLNLKDTRLRIPPFSAPLVPFRWMNKENASEMSDEKGFYYDEQHEPKFKNFKSGWVNGGVNQESILNRFIEEIQPDNSLCIFYAKETPLTDENRQVIIGVGRVKDIKTPKLYNLENEGGFKSYIWEMPMQHTIRPDFKDGFLLPYKELLELSEDDPDLHPEDYVVYPPSDRRMEFAYGTEHVTHDATIDVLLECKRQIERFSSKIDGPWSRVLKWIDDRLNELWKLRGPYPGFGSALKAFGINHGAFLAYQISKKLDQNEDPWDYLNEIFEDLSSADEDYRKHVNQTHLRTWNHLKENQPERIQLLKLISRFEITEEQAERFYNPTVRNEKGIDCNDTDLLENPYLIYELDRFSLDGISFFTIDRGVYPESSISEAHELPTKGEFQDESHPYRVRALICYQLEREAAIGHTLQSRDKLITDISSYNLAVKCPITTDILNAIESDFFPLINVLQLPDNDKAYQLERYLRLGKIIKTEVEKRLKGKPHELPVNWEARLEETLGISLQDEQLSDEESKAKKEKVAALETLSKSRFSVLVGAAGTGKTTLLKALCSEPSLKERGILLLAPTGKARIQLQSGTSSKAQTIAQFLLKNNRYDVQTGRYHISDAPPFDEAKTVVIDESSMLTEDQLGAVLDALRGVERLILVGDPYQLPPIGAGKPFYDIVSYIKKKDRSLQYKFPRLGDGFVELTIKHRQFDQQEQELKDLQLADWFCDQPGGPGEDEILSELHKKKDFKRLEFIKWGDMEDFDEKLFQILKKELKLESVNDDKGFALSLGGIESNGNTYFNIGSEEEIESWQILTPNRNNYFGVREINHAIHQRYKSKVISFAQDSYRRQLATPKGPEQITYGDKVYNVSNHPRKKIYPKKDDALKYIANGEIGVVVGQFVSRGSNWKGKARFLEVAFSSQPGYKYTFTDADFNDESNSALELAYALSVHKSQGSGFGKTILILPTKSRLVSRELLYTALTRHQDRVVVLHQMELKEIFSKSNDRYSESKKRLTNLFELPNIVRVDEDVFLDENLIHRTSKGKLVRSKSEVIIGILLEESGIAYEYEQPFIGTDGVKRYPDFYIEDAATGDRFFWEHCGMLSDPNYKQRWERKKRWYKEQNILPIEEGGGNSGTLIITEDKPDGGIDADEIKKLITRVF